MGVTDMTKFLALASVALLMLGIATAMAKGDAEDLSVATNKAVESCCSQFQKLADNKTANQAGRTKREAAQDYDSYKVKCGKKLCTVPLSGTGSTGPTRPPK